MTIELLKGNCYEKVKDIADASIDMCITSPPYYALRYYGDSYAVIGKEDPKCEHEWQDDASNPNVPRGKKMTMHCAKCGAWYGQLGLEPTVKMYTQHLCDLFDMIKPKLKETGCLWVNLGDSYSKGKDVVAKSLCNVPNRFSVDMCDRGWILRNEVIWYKKTVMPQSCTDRFTNNYEPFFFFVKNPKYYFKQKTFPYSEVSIKRLQYPYHSNKSNQSIEGAVEVDKLPYDETSIANGRNMRAVWYINPSCQRNGVHIAPFPKDLLDVPFDTCVPENGTVLDPFAGSGTTLKVCQEKGVNGVGIELMPEYIDVIEKEIDTTQQRLS